MGFSFNQHRNVKDTFNEPAPDGFTGYTNPSGSIKISRGGRQTFVPEDLPPVLDYDQELVLLLAGAERAVGELKGKGSSLKNPHILLRAYLKREAVVSSKIEGTLASIEDLNKYEVLGIGKMFAERLRLQEVVNHVAALEWALKKIRNDKHEIDRHLIQGAHKILMDGVRGQEKNPGKFRDRQNAIVQTRGLRSKIIYTPPPPEIVPELLQRFEKFCEAVHDDIPVLIQCALIHYQFEAIHPFGDGNGRIGRLLVLLMLCKRDLLPEPLLYLSAFFDTHQKEYYSGLLEVSRKSEWSAWVKFFLRAIAVQATDAIYNIKRLEDLHAKYRRILHDRKASRNAVELMEILFENPYISIPVAKERLGVSYPTAKGTVDTLVSAGILAPTDIPHRSKIFAAAEIEASLKMP